MIIPPILLVIAILAGILGFGVIAGPVGWVAIGFFFCFTILFGLSLVYGNRITLSPAKPVK